MNKKVSLYVFYQFNPNKQFANFQIVGIPSSKNILQVRQTELLKIDMSVYATIWVFGIYCYCLVLGYLNIWLGYCFTKWTVVLL